MPTVSVKTNSLPPPSALRLSSAYSHGLPPVLCLQAGTVHNAGVVGFFTVCNLTLTFLQWYWGYLIIRAAVKMLSGGGGGGGKAEGKSKGD